MRNLGKTIFGCFVFMGIITISICRLPACINALDSKTLIVDGSGHVAPGDFSGSIKNPPLVGHFSPDSHSPAFNSKHGAGECFDGFYGK